MRFKRILNLVMSAGAGALWLLGSTAARAQTYQQVWADEFDNGLANWTFDVGGGTENFGNNEREYYQAANATVAGGELRITARKENVGNYAYTSARLKTQGIREFTYGKFEARMKLPMGQGLWPAFWMLGTSISTVNWPYCGEIDVMEHVNDLSTVNGTAHWYNDQSGNYTTTTPADYHVYAVEWTPTFIKWFVDGVQYHVLDISNSTDGKQAFQQPFFLLLNLAVGGDWPGQTVDDSKLPATMYVDYVRVYQLTNNPPASSAPVATVYRDCSYGGYSAALPVGDYTLAQLQARGVVVDELSAVRVNSGYQVVLYENDNFSGNSATLRADDECLWDNPWDNQPLSAGSCSDQASSIRVRSTAPASVFIEAENYGNMSGVQVEPCSDTGGGQDVGSIDQGDFMSYFNTNFPVTGTYTIEYRVASPNGGQLSSDLNASSVFLGRVTVPITGGWQNWTTVTQTVNVTAGTYNFSVYAQTGGWNLNWIRITPVSSARPAAAAAAAGPVVV